MGSFRQALVAATAIATSSAYQFSEMDLHFVNWVAKHGRSYADTEEYAFRLHQFALSDESIRRINMTPGATHVAGHNKFSDWSREEKTAYSSGGGLIRYSEVKDEDLLDTSDLPTEVNWITKGAVGSVRDQGNCGSCWAFSAVGSIESAHQIKTGELLDLSEQQCVDCDKDSVGCTGGYADNCLWYVYDNGGISLEKDYPYQAGADMCIADYGGPVEVKTVNPVKSKSESQLMAAIALGPTSVSVDAETDLFFHYTSGILNDDSCGTKLDHAVIAVGYGTDEATGLDYYLVRNSWGADWGESGYIRLARGPEDGWGMCGIQEMSVYPTTN